MGNLITDRVSFFLKDVPPFDSLTVEDRNQIAQQITVQYFEEGDFIFQENAPSNSFVYVLQQGDVRLLKMDGEKDALVDQCEPGDIFGVRSILTKKPYSLSAKCNEESLLYAIPSEVFQTILDENQNFALFFAKGYAAGQVIVRRDEQNTAVPSDPGKIAHEFQYSTSVVSCQPSTTIKEAAQQMKQKNVGSIIVVDEKKYPIGIVTDTDLRNKVVAGDLKKEAKISEMMTSPVQTIRQAASISEVVMKMVQSGVHHLVMTADGTNQQEVKGVVSDHDVVVSQQNHPASFIKEIKRSADPREWPSIRNRADKMVKSYLAQDLSVSLISGTITKINDTLISKALDIAVSNVDGMSDISFCWMNLGSEGREEQLLRTDQDNAILFADTENNEATQKKLLHVAKIVTNILAECGFEKCPADIMASNPTYCQPLSVWKQYFTEWIRTPEPKALMHATIFFDFRLGWGNTQLADELSDHLHREIKSKNIFLNFLAQNALQNPPPLSFFKNFLVEDSGEHKNDFDIKKRAMMPLSDAARLLILEHKISQVQNTSRRYERLSEVEPYNASIFEAAAAAYQLFLKHRTISGLKHEDSGRFIPIEEMNKYEKQVLKNAFLSIREIQELIKVRFQQSYFS